MESDRELLPWYNFSIHNDQQVKESFNLISGKISVFSAGYSVHNFHISPIPAKMTLSIVLCYSTLPARDYLTI